MQASHHFTLISQMHNRQQTQLTYDLNSEDQKLAANQPEALHQQQANQPRSHEIGRLA